MAQTFSQHPRSSFGNKGGPSQPPHPPAPSFSSVVFGQEIDSKLYSDIAEEAAQKVGQTHDRNRNKPSQLRRFYDELVALQEKIGVDKERFDQHLPFIQMLKAKVAYAKGRDKVDETYRALLCRVVDQTIDVETLRQARLFMEAFMAFYKIHGPRD